jgi:alpha-1,6-mannosyltransferase
VDLQRFTPATDRCEHPVLRLISVGRLSAEKRPDLAIATLAELIHRGVKAELTLLGTGPWERRLRAQASRLPVRFAGFVTGVDSIATRLATADIALATGPAETFGLAALEGLACGTPTIAVSSAATAEFVAADPRAGRATTLDPVAFADAVISMLEVPVTERRQAARAVAERYSWTHTVDAMRAVHSEVRHIWSPPRVIPA